MEKEETEGKRKKRPKAKEVPQKVLHGKEFDWLWRRGVFLLACL